MSSTKPDDPKAQATSPESVILCAHGGEAGCSATEQHARRLQETGRFESVVACCLHGMPNLAMAFVRARAPRIAVVPMLMANGYTCQTVLPAAVAEVAPDNSSIRITPPLGASAGVGDIIARRALLACLDKGWQPAQAALVVVGHGTERDARSGETVERTATRLHNGGAFGMVRAGFLEQPPLVVDVLKALGERDCVVAGYFAEAGGHAQHDLPEQIRSVRPAAAYLGPVGADPEITDVLLDLVAAGTSSTSVAPD